ncbi:uncharacterized protein LOC8074439 [Sorghum bicolor]|uniref:uncharacterized protein LOC8074439 n=1 Tax=Sorghum bicolor TaxID=4558 RepID=UPI000B4245A9|nr:uncharacterized protein LOC8074439 [Sorghum bicolor]|eukprot:XP_021310260.1 uncharacterized protein LOC8074439 [Sorghum bicolor]
MSKEMIIFLERNGFAVKPQMVNDRTIEMAYALCENKHAKSLQDMEDISGVMKKVSGINFDDWDSLKRVFVVKIIICYPEETENSKMFSDNELSKLLSIAPSLEGKLFIKNTCMEIYEDIVFARAVRVKSVED